MKIDRIITQRRRDFVAIFVCEHCNHKVEKSGYDDTNFHRNVIPKMPCPNCGKVADENYRPLETKYKEWEVV